MKKILTVLFSLFFAFPELMHADNKQILLDFGWKFSKGECNEAEQVRFDDSKWESIDLPHDWSIAGEFSKSNPSFSRGAWLPAGKCAYRKMFTVDKNSVDKRFEIYIDGAYRNAQVWVNGYKIGHRPWGYISFFCDMTSFVKEGENIITIKLDNSSQPGGRWYTGTGIYRHVFLNISDKLFVPTWGTYVYTKDVTSKNASVIIETKVTNKYKDNKLFDIKYSLLDGKGNIVSQKIISNNQIRRISTVTLNSSLDVKSPNLWNLETPYLYTLKTELISGGKSVYCDNTKLGIRTMDYDANTGFKLNRKRIKIKGVCLHEDNGPLGAAIYKRAITRKLEILRSMGCNALRLTHNPFSTEFMNVCDSMGFLVLNEAFDEWQVLKEPSIIEDGKKGKLPVDYYAKLFDDWAEKDLTDFVIRDRNHPCIFMWSIGNEIGQMKKDDGELVAMKLVNIVHQLDNRPITNGANGYGWNAWPSDKAVTTSDVLGYNYIKDDGLDKERKEHPLFPAIITECSCIQSYYPRGTFVIGKEKDAFWNKLHYSGDYTYQQCEKSKLYREEGLDAWKSIKHRDNIIGSFFWTGFDYLGEVTPFGWPARSSSFAPIDLCGFPKDGFYFYQSQWADKPMVHIYPHWNFEGHQGEIIPVQAYSNCDEVELFLNNKSLGRKKNNVDAVEYERWEVKYTPGTLKAVGYKNNKVVATDIVKTSGKAYKIIVSADRKCMQADGQDLIYLECIVVDKKGNIVPNANNLIEFEVNGPAKIIGVGNGDNMSHEPFQSNKRSAFNGKCLAIIKSSHKKGEIIFAVKSNGLKSSQVVVISK